jgi:predicted DNA-binding protein (UPF0251 family)
MARPIKWRRVEFIPENRYYLPCPKGNCGYLGQIAEIQLKVEELEAMRLKDIEELSQEECAERMQISRQTFQLIIDQARKKVAIALIEGKAISVGGGHYTKNVCKFKCMACGDETETSFEDRRRTCKHCGSKEVTCSEMKCCHTDCGEKSLDDKNKDN